MCSIGELFRNFTCYNCKEIEQSTDFRFRVFREGGALVKRSSRDTQCGRRVDYLSSPKLATHSETLARKYGEEKARQ